MKACCGAIRTTIAQMAETRLFLGVENSATGRAWRDRLDERGSARALAIAQRHDLARTARPHHRRPRYRGRRGRGLSRSDDQAADARPLRAHRHGGGGDPPRRCRRAGRDRSPSSATTTSTARPRRRCSRAFCATAASIRLIHIPDRIFEGYGPNVEAIRALAERGATLLVTVDCGTTSIEPLAEAKQLGLDVVVIDHHQADEMLPPAVAIVNPNRLDDLSGLGHLAAVGLVFMTIGRGQPRAACAAASGTATRPEPDLLGLLDDRRARHRRRRGAAQRAQPRLRRQGPDRAAPARAAGA